MLNRCVPHRCHSPTLHDRSAEAQGMMGDGEMLREKEPTLERTRSAGEVHAQPFISDQILCSSARLDCESKKTP